MKVVPFEKGSQRSIAFKRMNQTYVCFYMGIAIVLKVLT